MDLTLHFKGRTERFRSRWIAFWPLNSTPPALNRRWHSSSV